jgi:hypothetical protein
MSSARTKDWSLDVYESPAAVAPRTFADKENIDPQTGMLSPTTRDLKGAKSKLSRQALRDITARLKPASGIGSSGGDAQWTPLEEETEVRLFLYCFCPFCDGLAKKIIVWRDLMTPAHFKRTKVISLLAEATCPQWQKMFFSIIFIEHLTISMLILMRSRKIVLMSLFHLCIQIEDAVDIQPKSLMDRMRMKKQEQSSTAATKQSSSYKSLKMMR